MARAERDGAALSAAVEKITGIALSDHERLARALTHASVQAGAAAHYERLEFLGDRVLGLVIAQMLFEAYPDAAEGELSVRLNGLVNAETLAELADEIGLTPLIRTGAEFGSLSGKKRINTRSDVMEALIAAIYLEKGLAAAESFILAKWSKRAKGEAAGRRDAKTELQEWAHQRVKVSPVYRVDSREGPDHDPVFTVSVLIEGLAPGQAKGRSKREAEQAAATAILTREGVWKDETR
ncbi:MAG: ribonuclease III [Aliihoeflea sp.]